MSTPDTPAVANARESARRLAAQRKDRVRLIRRRVVATSLTIFAVAWSVIFFELVGGNDPGLANGTKATPAQTSTNSSSSSQSSTDTGSSGSSSSQDPSTSVPSSPAPVTTSQS